MHLIKKKIAGKELPAELPLSLIPPGLRPAQPAAPGAFVSLACCTCRERVNAADAEML